MKITFTVLGRTVVTQDKPCITNDDRSKILQSTMVTSVEGALLPKSEINEQGRIVACEEGNGEAFEEHTQIHEILSCFSQLQS